MSMIDAELVPLVVAHKAEDVHLDHCKIQAHRIGSDAGYKGARGYLRKYYKL